MTQSLWKKGLEQTRYGSWAYPTPGDQGLGVIISNTSETNHLENKVSQNGGVVERRQITPQIFSICPSI